MDKNEQEEKLPIYDKEIPECGDVIVKDGRLYLYTGKEWIEIF